MRTLDRIKITAGIFGLLMAVADFGYGNLGEAVFDALFGLINLALYQANASLMKRVD